MIVSRETLHCKKLFRVKHLSNLTLVKIFKRLLKYHKNQNFGIKVNFTKFYIGKLKHRQILRILHDNYKTNTNYHLCFNRAKFGVFKCC